MAAAIISKLCNFVAAVREIGPESGEIVNYSRGLVLPAPCNMCWYYHADIDLESSSLQFTFGL